MCSNYIYVSDSLGKCIVLNNLGIEFIISDNRRSSPCVQCKKQWTDTPPTEETLTNVMKTVLKSNAKISLPTITEQAVSVTKSIIEWAYNGFENVPPLEAERRLSICKENKCGMYDAESDRCSACGCFCSAKVKFSHEDCPAGLWGKKDLGAEVLNNAPKGGCGSCGKR